MSLIKFIFVTFLILSCSQTVPKNNDIKRETASLDVGFERKDKGVVISEQERQAATDDLISIIKNVPYFDFIDSRAHGISENNTEKKYWWGHWWTGVRVEKLNGNVTYVHPPTGSDNTGIQTAPYLEGACFAYLLTQDQKYAKLARKMIRGMSAWVLSSAKSENNPGTILSRSFYPKSTYVDEGARKFYINYDINRPGTYNGVAQYIHNPSNPYFGDIYLKNNRSTDDIGHMIRAIANVRACREKFDDETKADLDQMDSLYTAWAKSVDDNKFIIPTHNEKLETISLEKGIGDYNAYNYGFFNPACVEKLAVRLLHSDDSKDMKCGKGISPLEKLLSKNLQNDAIEILRSHHTAAVALAKSQNQPELAKELMKGMQDRMDRDFSVIKNNSKSPKFDLQDIPSFFIHANNVGIPMTSEEMRYVYERLHMSKVALSDPANYNLLHVFNPSVPDGTYNFDAPHAGLYFYAIGTMIGSCTSIYRDTHARQFLDCDRLRNALLK